MRFPVQKIIIAMILCVGIVLETPGAQADSWGANQAAAVWTYAVNKIERHIEGVLLGSLKMAAMNMLNSQIGQLIGGGGISGSPRFITNWNDELFLSPQRNAQLYMNDFFTISTRGMASSANYVGRSSSSGISDWSFSSSKLTDASREGYLNNPLAMNDPLTLRAEGMISAGGIGGGGVGNYAQYLERIGRATISGGDQRTMTLQEFTSSPEEMFRTGNWRAFDSFVSNPMNNPYGYSLAAEQAYQRQLEREKEIARTQAIAYQGFKGTEGAGGMVTTPGSTIKSLMDDANDFGNKIIAGATNPAELAGSLASAAVSKAINGLVNYGVNQVEKVVMKPINDLNREVTSAIRSVDQVMGPAAQLMTQAEREAAGISGAIARSSLGGDTSRGGVGTVGACSGKRENDTCMGSQAGTCKFTFEPSGGDNGLRCLEGLKLNEPCPSGVRDSYGGCAVEETPASVTKKALGSACSKNNECASNNCYDICILQCGNTEVFDYDRLVCRTP